MRRVNLITRSLLKTEINAFGYQYSKDRLRQMRVRLFLHSCSIIVTHYICR